MAIRNPHRSTGGKLIAPSGGATGSTDGLTPIFCLTHLAPPYCVTSCQGEEIAAFGLTLRKLASMTWAQIRNAPRHGLGTEKIAQASLRAPIPPTITQDVVFLAIRFYRLAPMVGYRSGQVFHIVWLDRAFDLYDHG